MFNKKEENQKRINKKYIIYLENDYNAAKKYFKDNKWKKKL